MAKPHHCIKNNDQLSLGQKRMLILFVRIGIRHETFHFFVPRPANLIITPFEIHCRSQIQYREQCDKTITPEAEQFTDNGGVEKST